MAVSGPISNNRYRPVLFVHIGWSERYDGEEVKGNHEWLTDHADDCSEMHAFTQQEDGVYHGGIGEGAVHADSIDVVFIARREGHGDREVVGVYLDAWVDRWGGVKERWMGAFTRTAYLFPSDRRPTVPEWPGYMSMRRWARRDRAQRREHASLLELYYRVLAQLPHAIDGDHEEAMGPS